MSHEVSAQIMLKTNLAGKIRNLAHFKNEALLPLFEAVVNSIQAIEENGDISKGKIIVRILRSPHQKTLSLEEDSLPNITGFEIEDNGIGFNDDNFDSFQIAESAYKIKKGCKGVGRFLWLKAFREVEIESIYKKPDNSYSRRIIDFTINNGVKERLCEDVENQETRTVVKLIGFDEDYRRQSTAYKTCNKIAQRLFEHNIARYICDLTPEITVIDQCNIKDQKIRLSDLYNNVSETIIKDGFKINESSFTIYHIRLYATRVTNHQMVFCAHGTGVKLRSIGSILGTSAQFDDEGKKYYYSVYVTSPFLDDNVDTYRQEFTIPETRDLYTTDSITMEEIEQKVIEKTKEHLSSVIEFIELQKKTRISNFIETESPMLRAVLKYCPEVLKDIDLNTSEEKMIQTLYSYKGKAEYAVKEQSKKFLKTQANSVNEINSEYLEITKKVEDFQKDQLTAYIISRKMIIDLLDKKLELNKDGKYHNEDIIHDIVFPRKADSNSICYEDHNLWLINELLALHTFANSDNRLCDFTTSNSKERPDIVVYSEVDDDRRAREVSIIEFKKPQKKAFDEDPTKQLLRYVRQIRNNNLMLSSGRSVSVDDSTRFYCYAICSLTKQVHEFAENSNYAKLQSGYGYYMYNRVLNAHIEIIAFDKIVLDAKRRHLAFFAKLGINT